MEKTVCLICGKPMGGPNQGEAEWPAYPFCSPKCRLIDLGNWLSETYRIPSEGPAEEEAEEAE